MDMERVQAEVEAKFAAEQQNEDVMLRKIQAQVISHIFWVWNIPGVDCLFLFNRRLACTLLGRKLCRFQLMQLCAK